MAVTAEFLDQSEAALQLVMQEWAPRLVAASGAIAVEMKADKSPVTQLDLELESRLREALLAVDSGVGLQGEEHGIEGSRETYWLIDPIDGTEEFSRGIPAYRTMATLVDEGVPRYAFVYDVPQSEAFTARKGEGAFCNGAPLRLSERPFERALIECTVDLALDESLALMKAIRQNTRGVRRNGDFTCTPRGKFEGHLYYRPAGGPWDWTPWALIIQEAGGKVANLGSDTYDFQNPEFLAAAPQVFDKLKPILDTVLKDMRS